MIVPSWRVFLPIEEPESDLMEFRNFEEVHSILSQHMNVAEEGDLNVIGFFGSRHRATPFNCLEIGRRV